MVSPLLEVRGLNAGYGAQRVLYDITFQLDQGELLLLAGPNGAGKSTLMRCLKGIHKPESGEILLNGKVISKESVHQRAHDGMVWIPEGRGIIPQLTVRENLDLAKLRDGWTPDLRDRTVERFPQLARFLSRTAGSLSGGEQQMVAFARAIESRPAVLLLDEPSLGLAPLIVDSVMAQLELLREEGQSILLVEQRAAQVQDLASRTYLMRQGRLAEVPPGSIQFAEMDFESFAADAIHLTEHAED